MTTQGEFIPMRRRRWRHGLTGVGILLVLAVTVGVSSRLASRFFPAKGEREELIAVAVRRADLQGKLSAGGRVESAQQTMIECELENLEVGVRGQRMMAGGVSTVLSLVPEGASVKKGDILCQLDASEYEEMVRQQRMTVERARADHEMARLDLDVARMAVDEFRNGTLYETRKDFEVQIAMAQSTLERSGDRLAWTRRMAGNGYVPKSQVLAEQLAQARSAFTISQARTAREVFEKYTLPKTLRTLQSGVLAAEVMLNYQERRRQRNEERLSVLERQVENCTIRAPHDGFVIYYNEDSRSNVRIEEGSEVRQRQRLFYLPDLTKMEVQALVHESVASRVRPGMLAKVQVEGLPDAVVEGHVVSVAQLPARNWLNDVPYFLTHVQLDTFPRGLLPGMTAEVVIATTQRNDVLAVPPEALAVEGGQEVCYVAHEDGLERREVKIGESTRDLVEVREGLEEGEQVVLDPNQHEDVAEAITSTETTPIPSEHRADATAE
jgi:HlyD family secretion protein